MVNVLLSSALGLISWTLSALARLFFKVLRRSFSRTQILNETKRSRGCLPACRPSHHSEGVYLVETVFKAEAGTSSLREAFSCLRESACCRSLLCVQAQRLSFPLSSSCRELSCCFSSWEGTSRQIQHSRASLAHVVLSASAPHLDLLSLLPVRYGSGGWGVPLKYSAFLL